MLISAVDFGEIEWGVEFGGYGRDTGALWGILCSEGIELIFYYNVIIDGLLVYISNEVLIRYKFSILSSRSLRAYFTRASSRCRAQSCWFC